jgi:glutaminase
LNIDIQSKREQLRFWIEQCFSYARKGEIASYIPALRSAPTGILGIAIRDLNNNTINVGDSDYKFTLQSISKILTFLLALEDHGQDNVFRRVGMEPTGDPFNSIVKLETLKPTKPLNPMINAGAIAICDLVNGGSPDEKFNRIKDFIKKITNNNDIEIDNKVYQSEKDTGSRNKALAYFLKDAGVIRGDVEETLDIYYKQCALKVSCSDLSTIGVLLANKGKKPGDGEQIILQEYCKIANAFMVTCGLYDGSGEFAIKVGIPAKSGVSGGILASVPAKLGIGVIGTELDSKGNSIAGVELLKRISNNWNLSIFI